MRGTSILNWTVVVSALGYFVDIYDLVLFSIVRRPSLLALGVTGDDDLLRIGSDLLFWQMMGLLIGGVLWGVLGDKKGRVSVLFGSILVYSLANLANAFVVEIAAVLPFSVVTTYAGLRFIAGVGLAGELGAAITLVSEVMSKETRGYGAAVVASVGILGGIFAFGVSRAFDWKWAYIVGGVLGLMLLVARMSLRDSGLYRALADKSGRRGDLLVLFTSGVRFRKYAYSLLVGLPIWFVVGILVTFSPEFAPRLGVTQPVDAGAAIAFCYIGLATGDFASGMLSGLVKSRKWVFIGFLAFTSGLVYAYLFLPGMTRALLYTLCTLLGLGIGYWAVFLTNASEQFGTDIRATVTTTAPNFVRGALSPMLVLFAWLQGEVGMVLAAMLIGQATILVALFAVTRLPETYGKELDYLEATPSRSGAAIVPSSGAPTDAAVSI